MSANPAHALLVLSLDTALAGLRAGAGERAVHEARKALKRARAALRLLRDSMAEGAYRGHNRALRDAARALSPLRDAKVILDAYDALRKKHPGVAAGPGARSLRPLLAADLARARTALRARVTAPRSAGCTR